MQIVQDNGEDGVTIQLSNYERGLIGIIGVEFTQGANAPDDEEWEALHIGSREDVLALFEQLS